jgi:cell division protein ZapD
VDTSRLVEVLDRIAAALADIHAMTGKIGQHVRDNEWLLGIKGRAGIPGGTCSFDLPVYHFWLSQSTRQAQRRPDGMAGPPAASQGRGGYRPAHPAG